MSFFITFEGGEGSGKSTHARWLYRRLSRLGVPVLLTHEPGVTLLGKKMTHLLKWAKDIEISPVAELLMFNVSRSQLVAEVVCPALESGKVVICDRFADSTTAYQGYGRGLDLALVKTVNDSATQSLQPELTILLDVAVEQGLARKRSGHKDRFEQEEITFHQRVRGGFLKLAAAESQRWLVIDAGQTKDKISEIIWDRVNKLLSRNG
ncbi:dTMP kinase [Chloroflexota bacterium]